MVSGGASPNNREREEVSVPDPTQIEALPQLAVALNLLRRGRSYAELDRAVGGRSKARVLKSSTLSDLVNGKSVSSKDTLVTFLTACGLTESGQQPWLAAWERVATSHLRRPAGAVRVRTADPRLLGVHASIQADPGAEDLPAYVPRDVDADLRTAVTAAQDRGEFVLVKGSSSVGKTRTLFEAVKAVCPDWWLLHPVDAAAVRAFADAPTPRTVVWLDELQRYLSQPGGIPAGAVRGLLAAKLLVVATLWPSEYSPRTALRTPGEDDPYTEDRLLLRLARVFEVPDAFTPAERQRAEDLADDRLIKVALNAADGRVTQMLAAGPQLVRWWEHADVADPRQGYGKAVITAALDARRVGATAPLTRDFLTAAAPAYLTSVQQATAPPDWFEQAIDYATTLLDGATACLTPVAAGMRQIAGWTTADYLYQHARQIRRAEPLPDMTWQALVDYHHSDDTLRLTENAHRRNQLRVAEIFYRQNVDAGSWIAVEGLADVLVEQGRTDELRQLASSGQWIVAQRLAGLLTTQGRTGEAIAVLRQHADKGRWDAVERLADLLAKLGRIDEVIAVLGEHVDNGRWDAGHRLIDLLAELGRTYELRQLARTARWYAVKQLAGHRLAGVLAEQGRTDDLRQLADDGNWVAAQRLADLLTKEGHPDEAIAVVRQHAHYGRWDAVERLADLLAEQGRIDEAIAVLRQDANAGR